MYPDILKHDLVLLKKVPDLYRLEWKNYSRSKVSKKNIKLNCSTYYETARQNSLCTRPNANSQDVLINNKLEGNQMIHKRGYTENDNFTTLQLLIYSKLKQNCAHTWKRGSMNQQLIPLLPLWKVPCSTTDEHNEVLSLLALTDIQFCYNHRSGKKPLVGRILLVR